MGTAYPFPHRFLDYPAVLDRQIIDVNVRAITNMTRLALPRMVERFVFFNPYYFFLPSFFSPYESWISNNSFNYPDE